MARSPRQFAELLQKGIAAIADRTSKPKGVVRDELGYAIGRKGGSAIEYWAYGDGRIPRKQSDVAALSRHLVDAGNLDYAWLVAFLQNAGYPESEELISELFPNATDQRSHNLLLPIPSTPFVGRDQELVELAELIANPDCRLITLVGPGGSGKTRLAIEVARSVYSSFADGAAFVALAPLSSADLIAPTMATSLGLTLAGETTPQTQLLHHLRRQERLLLLDNFEHLLTSPSQSQVDADENPSVVLITSLLQGASDVTILITSRERLNIQEEWVYDVDGLETPTEEEATSKEYRAEEYSALMLFVQTARRLRTGFNPTRADQAAISRICHEVEGMLLALELAAAWVRSLSCYEIAKEISTSLDFLSTRQRDLPVRHRSMRAVFESVWQLLSDGERTVLSQVSVFRGGFDREAAQAVAGATLAVQSSLVEKSVLRLTREPSEFGRYQIHELLRQFAYEKLANDTSEQAAVHERHIDYFVTFLQQREKRLHGKERPIVLAEIQNEIENVHAAWSWAVDQGQFDAINRALVSLHDYYAIRNLYRIGKETYMQALTGLPALRDALSQGLRGKLSARLGVFSAALGAYDESQEQVQAGLLIARHLDNRSEIVFCLNVLSRVMQCQRRYVSAQQLALESLTLSREIRNQVGIATALYRLGFIAVDEARYAEAKVYTQDSLNLSRVLEHVDRVAYALNRLGQINFIQGDYAESDVCYQESLHIFREIGDRSGMIGSLGGIARNMVWGHREARFDQAKSIYQENLAVHRETGNCLELFDNSFYLGLVCIEQGAYEAARSHALEALRLTETFGLALGKSSSLKLLGDVAVGQGDFMLARYYLQQALTLASGPRSFVVVTGALMSWANLLVKERASLTETARVQGFLVVGHQTYSLAAECMTLVMRHPASWQIHKDLAVRLLTELEAELSPSEFAAVQALDHVRDVETIVTEVLASIAADKEQMGLQDIHLSWDS